jgi:hypothetical protein
MTPRLPDIRRTLAFRSHAPGEDRAARAGAGHVLSRTHIFALLAAVCLMVAVGYTAWTVQRNASRVGATASLPEVTSNDGNLIMSTSSHADISPSLLGASGASPMLFRSTAVDDTYGKVGLVPFETSDAARTITTMQCERVHFAAGKGLCLVADRGIFTAYSAFIFGPDLQPQHSFPLSGIPSRTRVSPDGRYGTITVFVSGHSYAAGSFSTLTTLIDMKTGAQIGELEQFEVTRDGQLFRAADFNFWGVTFARDSNRFYATLASGGKTYLVEGDLAARHLRVRHENVECPSLSPDNTRIAYKKQVGRDGRSLWHIHILDLSTQVERPLGEVRDVDDQVEWLDDQHVLYALPDEAEASTAVTNVWVAPTDGSEPPRILLARAYSPAVVR